MIVQSIGRRIRAAGVTPSCHPNGLQPESRFLRVHPRSAADIRTPTRDCARPGRIAQRSKHRAKQWACGGCGSAESPRQSPLGRLDGHTHESGPMPSAPSPLPSPRVLVEIAGTGEAAPWWVCHTARSVRTTIAAAHAERGAGAKAKALDTPHGTRSPRRGHVLGRFVP